MHRFAAAVAACALWMVAFAPGVAGAQEWNSTRTRALVERATARRAQQLADTGLKDYKAVAHGYVTFLAQVGEGLAEPPKVVKADELVNEIYWLAPNLSKQHIVGRRDTLLLPTDISYHRDHLGIVQNNFPAIIRLGDGDEVVDVPHPLSTQGLATYDFAITPDSFSLQLPGRTIRVLEVKVRPKNDREPRIIGAVYIDPEDAQVVRMAFNFTRAAFRDNALEDLFVIVENSLVSGRFWLPARQELEIRRGGTWLDYPIRGIIRGRWEIRDYQVNVGLSPAFFRGNEIELAPKTVLDTFHFGGRILDSLPFDVRAVTNAEVRKVQEEARSLVRAQALQRPQALTLAAGGISDFVRFDRVEGFAVGLGVASRFGAGVGARGTARYGIDDREVKASVGVDWQSPDWGLRLYGSRDFREAGDLIERSRIINSIAAQEFGSDATDPFGVQTVGVGVDSRAFAGMRMRLDATIERQRPLAIHAVAANGTFDPLVSADRVRVQRLALGIERPTSLSFFGTELRGSGEVRVSHFTQDDAAFPFATSNVGRAFASFSLERPYDAGRLALSLAGGAVGGSATVPPQDWLYFGGPVSGPGYRFHELAALAGATARAEWRVKIPAPSFSLGRFGRIPGEATLAPFAQATYARRASSADFTHPEGAYPSVGLALQPLFDLMRLQVARGLRNGAWTFNVDVSREFWGIL
ncbi:hypothetical protein BH11GEM2_BH11GEM2_30040 [soil metagenome]